MLHKTLHPGMGTFLKETLQKPIVMFLWYVWQVSVLQIFSSAEHSTDYVGQYEYQTNMFDQQYLRVVYWWPLSSGIGRGHLTIKLFTKMQISLKFLKLYGYHSVTFWCLQRLRADTLIHLITNKHFNQTIPRKLKEILGVLPMVQYHQHTSPISICKH